MSDERTQRNGEFFGAFNDDGRCVCGHLPEQHVRLPGHPDGAEECYGSEDCDCGQWRPALKWRSEW